MKTLTELRALGSHAHKADKRLLRQAVNSKLKQISAVEVESQSTLACRTVCAHPAFRTAKRISVFVSMPQVEIDTTGIIVAALEAQKEVFVPFLHKVASTAPPVLPPSVAGNGDDVFVPTTTTTAGYSRESGRQPDSAVMAQKEEEKSEQETRPAAGKRSTMDMIRIYTLQDFRSLKPDRWGIPSLDPESVPTRHNSFGGLGVNRDNKAEHHDSSLDLMIVPGVAFDTNLDRLGHGMGYYDRFLGRFDLEQVKKPFLMGVALKEQLLPSGETVPTDPWDERLLALVTGDGVCHIRETDQEPVFGVKN